MKRVFERVYGIVHDTDMRQPLHDVTDEVLVAYAVLALKTEAFPRRRSLEQWYETRERPRQCLTHCDFRKAITVYDEVFAGSLQSDVAQQVAVFGEDPEHRQQSVREHSAALVVAPRLVESQKEAMLARNRTVFRDMQRMEHGVLDTSESRLLRALALLFEVPARKNE